MAAVAREEAARAARAAGGRNRASDVLSGKNSKRFLSVGVKKVILAELSAGALNTNSRLNTTWGCGRSDASRRIVHR